MLFIDETVPAVSLSTILVVLVQESDRDNVHIKPIVTAVENKLYNNERRFLDRNKALIRRERLFHHMQGSTYYDVYNVGKHEEKLDLIFQESLGSSRLHEAVFTRYVEPFQKMQALEAELFFLLEDYNRVNFESERNFEEIWQFYKRESDIYIPSNLTEFIALFRVAATSFALRLIRPDFFDCASYAKIQFEDGKENYAGDFWRHNVLKRFKNFSYLNVPTKRHKMIWINMSTLVCEHFRDHYNEVYVNNQNHTLMTRITTEKKYEMIQQFVEERKKRETMNNLVFDHFHGKGQGSQWHPHASAQVGHPEEHLERPEYANFKQRYEIVDGIEDLMRHYHKADEYKSTIEEIKGAIDAIVKRLNYHDLESLEEIVRYLKHGSKQNDLKYHRSTVHEQYLERELPSQKKKRGLVELQGMEMTEEQIKAYEETDPVNVKVDQAFQVIEQEIQL